MAGVDASISPHGWAPPVGEGIALARRVQRLRRIIRLLGSDHFCAVHNGDAMYVSRPAALRCVEDRRLHNRWLRRWPPRRAAAAQNGHLAWQGVRRVVRGATLHLTPRKIMHWMYSDMLFEMPFDNLRSYPQGQGAQ